MAIGAKKKKFLGKRLRHQSKFFISFWLLNYSTILHIPKTKLNQNVRRIKAKQILKWNTKRNQTVWQVCNVKKLIPLTFEHGTQYILSKLHSNKRELEKILILFGRHGWKWHWSNNSESIGVYSWVENKCNDALGKRGSYW